MHRSWKSARIAIMAVAASSMLVVLGCRDANPVQPIATAPGAASNDLLGSLTGTLTTTVQKTVGFLSCKQRPEAWAAAVIGKDGGTIEIGDHSLTIPRGALASPVTITAHAPKGTLAEVEFEPTGLVFAKPATLTMSYANCNTLGSLLPKRIAYVDGNLNILYYLLGSIDNLGAQTVSAPLPHFSDYVMSW